jgi:hypothetical protein
MASGAAKESSGLLSRDGFKRFRNKGDNDRFLSYMDQGREDDGSTGPWFLGSSNENPADRSPLP